MTWRIEFDPTAAKELRKLGEMPARRIVEFLSTRIATLDDPRNLGEALKGKLGELWKYRIGDYRIYFERHELGVVVHRILSRNTVKDFLFRSSLPLGEDEALQENPKFWELIEAARTSAAKH